MNDGARGSPSSGSRAIVIEIIQGTRRRPARAAGLEEGAGAEAREDRSHGRWGQSPGALKHIDHGAARPRRNSVQFARSAGRCALQRRQRSRAQERQ